jgi:hypothetical protein
MAAYWLIYFLISISAISFLWTRDSINSRLFSAFFILILTIFVGFRFEIGVDWKTYEIIFQDLNRLTLVDAILIGDPAYSAINWFVGELGGAVWHVNLICGAIFAILLIRFCGHFKEPATALLAVFPLLVIITAMGYTRQAVGIAFVLQAIVSFEGRLRWGWLGWLTAGLPLFIISASRERVTSLVVGGGIALILLLNVVLQGLEETLTLYVGSGLESSGTLFRAAIGAFSAMCFFLIPARYEIFGQREILWRNMSIFALALFPLAVAAPSATIIDRTGVLLIPLQAAVFSGIVTSQHKRPATQLASVLAVVIITGFVMWGWFEFAQFSSYWLPYRNVLTEKFL